MLGYDPCIVLWDTIRPSTSELRRSVTLLFFFNGPCRWGGLRLRSGRNGLRNLVFVHDPRTVLCANIRPSTLELRRSVALLFFFSSIVVGVLLGYEVGATEFRD